VSSYEILIACTTLINLALATTTFFSNRAKANGERLATLEKSTADQFKAHNQQLAELQAAGDVAVTHDHLAEVYRDIKGIAEQVHTMLGQQEQMNQNLRLILNSLVVK
jgi:hypothetical protein